MGKGREGVKRGRVGWREGGKWREGRERERGSE